MRHTVDLFPHWWNDNYGEVCRRVHYINPKPTLSRCKLRKNYLLSADYTYCISRRNFCSGMHLRVLGGSNPARRCAINRRARGDTERARETSTTPPSAARSARGAPAGASLLTSMANPEEVAPLRYPLALRDHPVASTGGETTPSPHHSTGGDAHLSILFSPPGHGFSTREARWKPLL
jgi:hypothetical protein